MVLKSFIFQCTALDTAGCLFTAFAQLHGIANKTIVAQALIVPVVLLQTTRVRCRPHLWRFQPPLPPAFALLWFVAYLGGSLHSPNNYGGFAYRMLSLLTWLGAGDWTWIRTATESMDQNPANFRKFDDCVRVETIRSFRAEMGGS
jgi:hypothetical protein